MTMADITIHKDCLLCGKTYTTPPLKREDIKRYMEGTLVQDVWPDLTTMEREVIIAARCGVLICCDE